MFDFRERILRHPWSTPTVAMLCLAVTLGAMGTVSVVVLNLERGQKLANQQRVQEQNVYLALLQMDSALSPMIAQENARPYFTYSPFYAPDHAYNRMFRRIDGEVLIPSPLLTFTSSQIRMHFQIEPDGSITSPKVPVQHMRELAEVKYRTHEQIEDDAKDFRRLVGMLTREKVETALSPPKTPAESPAGQTAAVLPALQQEDLNASFKNQVDFTRRKQANAQNIINEKAGSEAPSKATAEDVFQPVWIDDNLFMIRHVNVEGQTYLQGCWLNWPEVRTWLLSQVQELLPGARLLPATSDQRGTSLRLAALPIMLVPGPLPEVGEPVFSWLRVSLMCLWTGLILAALAAAILLRGALLLSERRAAFVSAVTHELRTPLTTFRLYSQMLSQGMVRDPQQQTLYLRTLESEADRLAHLVENVLAYARLERVGPVGEGQPVRLEQLLSGMGGRLAQRAVQSGMTLAIDVPQELLPLQLQAEPAGVEQTLFNLVDNACKYAAAASDRRIHLEAIRRRGRLILRVRDHGPGLSADVRDRLFRPFSKSAQAAAGSSPGVGLGLALALRYARHMGGDLAVERAAEQGACFAMSLKVIG